MNITLSKYLIYTIIWFACILHSQANEVIPDSTFRLMLEVSGGYTASVDSSFLDGGITPCIRLMWEPDHKLNIGIETGYMIIEKHTSPEQKYDAGKTSFDVSLKAIPIIAVFNMELWKTDFYAAMGASYVWTELDAFDDKVYSPVWNYSLMFGWGYTYMFNENIGLGIEAKDYFFTRLNKQVASFQLKLKYCILDW
ncbi:MAG: hypothetical protein V1779_12530 [bacterium]